jgi:hypothetical protein
MRRQIAAAAMLGVLALGGCGRFGAGSGSPAVATPTPLPTPIVTTDTSILVITGSKDHQAITDPLRQVRQVEGPHDAAVTVNFTHPQLLGIEGAVEFLQATNAEQDVVLDAVIDEGGATVQMTPGTYRLTAYYRTCDGNCGFLDPPDTFCSADATLAPNGRYRLAVDMTANRCTLE